MLTIDFIIITSITKLDSLHLIISIPYDQIKIKIYDKALGKIQKYITILDLFN
jgi:hypothetical protein